MPSIYLNNLLFLLINIIRHNIENIFGRVPYTRIVEMKHLIKDAVVSYLDTKGEKQLRYTFVPHKGVVCLLPNCFPSFEVSLFSYPSHPFLLIPLFEIEDPKGQDVSRFLFPDCNDFNGICPKQAGGLFCNTYAFVNDVIFTNNIINSIEFQEKVIILPRERKFNYLLFMNSLSKTQMLYIGMFIDKTNFVANEELGNLYQTCKSENNKRCEEEVCDQNNADESKSLNGSENKDVRVSQNGTFKISLNIKDLLDGIVYFAYDSSMSVWCRFKLSIKTEIKIVEETIMIKLEGKRDSAGYPFVIEKYGAESLDNIKVKLTYTDQESKKYLERIQRTKYESS
ncbi:hypothetical protein CDIK_3925 [Cucumispora dikerogammari]|nr:hypothetical protein CDIK_3925 [Cucumispora dikerogammari]